MASYNSTLYTAQLAGRSVVPGPGLARQVLCAIASVATDTALAAADILNFFFMPTGAEVVDGFLKATDIDSNGSPTIAFNVGDAGSATRFFTASVVGQAGTIDRNMNTGGFLYQFTAKTLVFATVSTVAATKVAGTVWFALFYRMPGVSTS